MEKGTNPRHLAKLIEGGRAILESAAHKKNRMAQNGKLTPSQQSRLAEYHDHFFDLMQAAAKAGLPQQQFWDLVRYPHQPSSKQLSSQHVAPGDLIGLAAASGLQVDLAVKSSKRKRLERDSPLADVPQTSTTTLSATASKRKRIEAEEGEARAQGYGYGGYSGYPQQFSPYGVMNQPIMPSPYGMGPPPPVPYGESFPSPYGESMMPMPYGGGPPQMQMPPYGLPQYAPPPPEPQYTYSPPQYTSYPPLGPQMQAAMQQAAPAPAPQESGGGNILDKVGSFIGKGLSDVFGWL